MSKQIGGSPGAVNFPTGNQFTAPSGLVSYYDFDTLTGPAVDLADGNHGAFGAGAGDGKG